MFLKLWAAVNQTTCKMQPQETWTLPRSQTASLSPSLVNMKQMTIRYCGKLEYVFPVSVAPSLLNLEQMTIFADNLKQIFYSGEEDALPSDGIVKLPQLREMDLSSKSNYSFFGPKNFAAPLPFSQILFI